MKKLFTCFSFTKHFSSLCRCATPKLYAVVIAMLLAGPQVWGQCPAMYSIGCVGGVDVNVFYLPGVAGTSVSTPASGCAPSSWDHLTNDTVTLSPGGTYTATINSSSAGGSCQVFIDFDDDGTFTLAESVGGMNGVAAYPAVSTFTVAIPMGAATGDHFMRVMVSGDGIYPSIDGCNTTGPFGIGETHDYIALISTTSSSTCPAVTGLVASSVTGTGATINWAAATGSVGYKYIVNTTAAAPTGYGAFTAATSVSPTGLTPATVYYAHVRDTCGPASVSSWATVSFTTTATSGCTPITGLTASGVTNNSATISWLAVTGSAGYQYVINTTASAPVSSGTVTATTSISPVGLTPSTVYYAHVRDTCGPTSLSAWVTTSFTTTATAPSCMPVAGLTATGVTGSSATVSWTAATGVVGYKYIVNTTAASPTVPGTFTTLNSTPVSGLLAGTTYYAHVRDTCGVSNVSSWVTISFATTGTASVNNMSPLGGNLLTIAPNPVSGKAIIMFNGAIHGIAQVQIIDITGRVIKTIPLNSTSTETDMSSMSPGIYICKYLDAETATSIRITKQ